MEDDSVNLVVMLKGGNHVFMWSSYGDATAAVAAFRNGELKGPTFGSAEAVALVSEITAMYIQRQSSDREREQFMKMATETLELQKRMLEEDNKYKQDDYGSEDD